MMCDVCVCYAWWLTCFCGSAPGTSWEWLIYIDDPPSSHGAAEEETIRIQTRLAAETSVSGATGDKVVGEVKLRIEFIHLRAGVGGDIPCYPCQSYLRQRLVFSADVPRLPYCQDVLHNVSVSLSADMATGVPSDGMYIYINEVYMWTYRLCC